MSLAQSLERAAAAAPALADAIRPANGDPDRLLASLGPEGGGRILMDFTDLEVGEVETGASMEMVFRIKDVDDRRGFTRYFWKATPVRGATKA